MYIPKDYLYYTQNVLVKAKVVVLAAITLIDAEIITNICINLQLMKY